MLSRQQQKKDSLQCSKKYFLFMKKQSFINTIYCTQTYTHTHTCTYTHAPAMYNILVYNILQYLFFFFTKLQQKIFNSNVIFFFIFPKNLFTVNRKRKVVSVPQPTFSGHFAGVFCPYFFLEFLPFMRAIQTSFWGAG